MAEPTLVFVHAMTPPHRGGTAVVVHRLLRTLTGFRVEVFTDRRLREAVRDGGELVLAARYRYFARLGGPLTAVRALRELFNTLNVLLALGAGARAASSARAGGEACVLSVADGGFSQIAGAVAARLARRPHVIMVFDLWEENAYSRVERWLARRLERALFARADAVVVFCGEAAEHYRRKHGVACRVLATPIESAEASADGGVHDGEVLVAGAIYWAQEDAVRRLLRAAAAVPEATVTMVGDESGLRARGLVADSYEPELPSTCFRARVGRADVLFLGLAFDSPHPAVIATATPARLPEYMASGRPLLIHAPAGAHVVEYARAEGFAEVVDARDDGLLADALRRLFNDRDGAAERAEVARRLAAERHAVGTVAREFGALLHETLRAGHR